MGSYCINIVWNSTACASHLMCAHINSNKDNDAMLLDVINENGNAFVINDIAIDATPFINQMAEIGFSLNAEGLSEGN